MIILFIFTLGAIVISLSSISIVFSVQWSLNCAVLTWQLTISHSTPSLCDTNETLFFSPYGSEVLKYNWNLRHIHKSDVGGWRAGRSDGRWNAKLPTGAQEDGRKWITRWIKRKTGKSIAIVDEPWPYHSVQGFSLRKYVAISYLITGSGPVLKLAAHDNQGNKFHLRKSRNLGSVVNEPN